MIKVRMIRCYNCNEPATMEAEGESAEAGQTSKWTPICVGCLVKLHAEEIKAEMEFVGSETFESLLKEIRQEYEEHKKDYIMKARRELEAEDKRLEAEK